MTDKIIIRGAREHNLKNIDVELPRDKFIVFTGLSGSGKSSLAFDTIYAEGQRRYVESLSSYARQFLGQMEKPDLDYIGGLSPSISIDQKSTNHNPRSTVGTVTEIYDYIRLLFARIGVPYCPQCGKKIEQQSIDQMVDTVLTMEHETKLLILAPVIRGRKGEYSKLFADMRKDGFVRVKVDGNMHELEEDIKLNKQKKHDIELVVDRIILRPESRQRISDSMETAMRHAEGLVIIENAESGEQRLFSQNYSCVDCGISMEKLTPRMFSFNSPFGACPTCLGLGTLMEVDRSVVLPDTSKSFNQNAIQVSGWSTGNSDSMAGMYLRGLAEHYGFSLDTPVCDLDEDLVKKVLYGTGKEKISVSYEREYGQGSFKLAFEGIIPNLERRYRETQSSTMKEELEGYMANVKCHECEGLRLKKEALSVKIADLNIMQICDMPVVKSLEFFNSLQLSTMHAVIAKQILKEVNTRIGFLVDVGLNYLSLSRAAGSLSGGEAQRIRLATQIGIGLVGVLYILDEPSIGLHQRDNRKLLRTLKNLRDLGNTLIVVEHDEETIMEADHVLDIGPLAGLHGGKVVAQGTPADILNSPESLTGQYISGKRKIATPSKRRKSEGNFIEVKGARENNLKNIDVKIPVGVMTCVTGVSGSGKSSLVNEIVYKTLARDLNRAKIKPGLHNQLLGKEYLDKVIAIDQSPIGRTPRSNPATYTGVFDFIRELFSQTPDARARGYNNGRFSFNVKGGRCEACHGDGIIKIEMHFLPDVYVPCEVCSGKRYNRDTLEVRYKGKNIFEILDMTVEEALDFFSPIMRIKTKLQTLNDVGLGYIKLGQPSTTLSGGEAQRVKLATELSKRSTGKTMYILDEPTTGLHMADVDRLITILQRLAEGGNTVLIIEHNLDVIKTADYIIDMGPEGGEAGGMVIAQGTPEEVANAKGSFTGEYLKNMLEKK